MLPCQAGVHGVGQGVETDERLYSDETCQLKWRMVFVCVID